MNLYRALNKLATTLLVWSETTVAIAMARRSGFESRVRAVLNGGLNHRPMSRVNGVAMGLFVLAACACVATMHAEQSEAAPAQPQAPSTQPAETATSPIKPPAEPDAEAIQVQNAVVLNPALGWEESSWAHVENPIATEFAFFPDARPVRFEIYTPSALKLWLRRLDLPVDLEQYPILVMRYRATGVHTTHSWYTLWLWTGQGGGHAVEMYELVSDGAEREVRRDLRPHNLTGSASMFALGMASDKEGRAVLELLDLRFEAAPDAAAPEPVEEDTPITAVVTAPDGKPVAGATVTVDVERLNAMRQAVTDEQGRVTLTPLVNEVGTHTLRWEAPGYATLERVEGRMGREEVILLSDGPAGRVIKLPAVPAVRYSGFVKNEEGQAIEKVAVSLTASGNYGPGVRVPPAVATVWTDATGKWESPLLPENLSQLTVKLSHPDYVSDRRNPGIVRAGVAELRTGDHVTVMERGALLSGTVVDSEGKPFHATVRRGGEGGIFRDPDCFMHFTDEQGRFAFSRLLPGTYLLTVQGSGCAPDLRKVTVSAETGEQTIQLEKAHRLRCRVVDQTGQPVPDVSVTVESWRGQRTLDVRLSSTDAEGRFVWDQAPADAVIFNLSKDGYAPVQGRALIATDEEQTIVITAPPPRPLPDGISKGEAKTPARTGGV